MEHALHFWIIKPWHLPELFQCLFMSYLFLGIPAFIALVGLGVFSERVRSFLYFLPIIGLGFGLVSGLFNAWDDHHYWSTGAQNHWFDVFAIPGAPGDGMANSYGGDWQEDEAWHYRGDIAVLNGLFWMSVGAVAMLPFRLLTRRFDAAPDSPNEITGANAGGPMQLPIRTLRAARIAQF